MLMMRLLQGDDIDKGVMEEGRVAEGDKRETHRGAAAKTKAKSTKSHLWISRASTSRERKFVHMEKGQQRKERESDREREKKVNTAKCFGAYKLTVEMR